LFFLTEYDCMVIRMLQEFRRISTEVKHTNPYWQYGFDVFERTDGSRGEYHFVHTPGSVMIIPRTERGTFLLQRQIRYLNPEKPSIEFPGGGKPPALSPHEAAQKELREEAHVSAHTLEHIGTFNPFNGVTDELCSVFFATDLLHDPLPQDEFEDFEYLELTQDTINEYIRTGIIWDGMTLAAWQLYNLSVFVQK
jgi:8-oxo-dGTP pyrophosphatase MutT (NUDIX family)